MGTDYCDGTTRPGNECEQCDGATNTWEPEPDGTSCMGGSGMCMSGTCDTGGGTCTDHGDCPVTGCCLMLLCRPSSECAGMDAGVGDGGP